MEGCPLTTGVGFPFVIVLARVVAPGPGLFCVRSAPPNAEPGRAFYCLLSSFFSLFLTCVLGAGGGTLVAGKTTVVLCAVPCLNNKTVQSKTKEEGGETAVREKRSKTKEEGGVIRWEKTPKRKVVGRGMALLMFSVFCGAASPPPPAAAITIEQ